ncbi:MAG: 50S ribosomal protein L22 [Candidatus Omnitrophota bacterium]|nr:50S ribosomal protein L22 [Candidatus Omnitrophota bacterium]
MAKVKEKTDSPVGSEPRHAKSVARYLRVSPRKVRVVINTVRYSPVHRAFGILLSIRKKGARFTEKVLKSAVANAKVMGLAENRLYISDIRADGGPMLKRFRPRSMGRADRILKRTTHLSLILTEGARVFRGGPAPEQESEEQGESKQDKKSKAAVKKVRNPAKKKAAKAAAK